MIYFLFHLCFVSSLVFPLPFSVNHLQPDTISHSFSQNRRIIEPNLQRAKVKENAHKLYHVTLATVASLTLWRAVSLVLDFHGQIVSTCVLVHLATTAKLSVVESANRFVQGRAAFWAFTSGELYSIVHVRHAHLAPWTNHPLTKVLIFILSQSYLIEKS